MEEYEFNKALSCIYTIQTNLDSLKQAMLCKNPYAKYCLEKLNPILNDTKCLISLFEGGKNDNNE